MFTFLKKALIFLILALIIIPTVFATISHAMLPLIEEMTQEREQLEASGKESNAYLTHTVVDLVYSSKGSVTTYTYEGDKEKLTINLFSVKPLEPLSASYRITPFLFELTNQYRPNTEISVSSLRSNNTVHTYTYGKQKREAMYSILAGLPDCLEHIPYHKDDTRNSPSHWSKKYFPGEIETPVESFKVTKQTTITERTQYLFGVVNILETIQPYSDTQVYSKWIDLNNISQNGSVTTYTYKDGTMDPQIRSFTVPSQSIEKAKDKIVHYVLGDLANTYRQSPFDTEMTMITHQRNVVPVYAYGNYKNKVLDEIFLGLPECLGVKNDPSNNDSSSNNDSDTSKSAPVIKETDEETSHTTFSINSTTYTVNNEISNESKTLEMDAAPEVKNSRTYVPVRYLAYALGVPDTGIEWNGLTQTVTIKKENITVSVTIGSNSAIVNNKPVKMDVSPYIKEIKSGGRTMLPARWIAEPLGAIVKYNSKTNETTIEIPKQG